MPLTYKEASFPADYRAVEVSQIMSGIHKLRSIAITGLAGMGKSNVVRSLSSSAAAVAVWGNNRLWAESGIGNLQ